MNIRIERMSCEDKRLRLEIVERILIGLEKGRGEMPLQRLTEFARSLSLVLRLGSVGAEKAAQLTHQPDTFIQIRTRNSANHPSHRPHLSPPFPSPKDRPQNTPNHANPPATTGA